MIRELCRMMATDGGLIERSRAERRLQLVALKCGEREPMSCVCFLFGA